MTRLYTQRHADAGERIEDDPEKDAARKITAFGQQQAWWTASVLREWDEQPSLILSSPLPRAAATAAIVSDILGVRLHLIDQLMPHLDVQWFLQRLLRDPDFNGLMIVGHHDNLLPALAAMNGIYTSPSDPPLAQMHMGEVRKLKVTPENGNIKEKWRLHPSEDRMTVGISSARYLS